jgi:alanyl-tRNA synthetase
MADGDAAESISQGQKGEIVLDRTAFYAEAGGQVGDIGVLSRADARAKVTDCVYRGSAIAHVVEVLEGEFRAGDEVLAEVDMDRRRFIMKNHTATHLLHAALRKALGPHVKQAGSLVAPDRLRFDFTHFAPVSPAEIEKLEDLVNEQIWRDVAVKTTVMDLERAMESGAMALFGEKYQARVRVVEVPGFSRELCGGTHVGSTGTIGLCKIMGEMGIAAGIRRMEAITGRAALERFRADERTLEYVQNQHNVSARDLASFLDKLNSQIRDLQKQVAELKLQGARANVAGMLARAREVRGVKVIAEVVPAVDRPAMRVLADELRDKLGSGVVVLGTPIEGKAALVAMVSKDLSRKLHAGKIIAKIAPRVGGSGGGKPELAEAGGKDSGGLADAIEESYSVVETLLGSNA